jgi:hypothetical protein
MTAAQVNFFVERSAVFFDYWVMCGLFSKFRYG